MKPQHLITALAATALLITGCGSNGTQAEEPEPTEVTTHSAAEHRPESPSDVTDQLDVDQWTERIQDDQITELNEDGVPIYATDNEYEVLLTDGVVESGYSLIAPIEDARYACYILAAAVGHNDELSNDIHEGIVAAQHLAQMKRIDSSAYPDVQEYKDDSKPDTHTKAAIIHLCPDTAQYFDDEMSSTPPFSEAIAELESH